MKQASLKKYFKIFLECLGAFTVASFSVAMFFTHPGEHQWLFASILISAFIVVIAICMQRILSSFPLPALMLMIPLLPLIPIILVLIFIPLLQHL